MNLSVALTEITFSGGYELQLNQGDLLVVVGPNNAGKSALLKLIRDSFFHSHIKAKRPNSPIGEGKINRVRETNSLKA